MTYFVPCGTFLWNIWLVFAGLLYLSILLISSSFFLAGDCGMTICMETSLRWTLMATFFFVCMASAFWKRKLDHHFSNIQLSSVLVSVSTFMKQTNKMAGKGLGLFFHFFEIFYNYFLCLCRTGSNISWMHSFLHSRPKVKVNWAPLWSFVVMWLACRQVIMYQQVSSESPQSPILLLYSTCQNRHTKGLAPLKVLRYDLILTMLYLNDILNDTSFFSETWFC